MWGAIIGAGLNYLSARKQRKQAKQQADTQMQFQQEQADLLNQQKIYIEI